MDPREADYEIAELEALYNDQPVPEWPWKRWEDACEQAEAAYAANPWWRMLRSRRLLREWQVIIDDWGREIYSDRFYNDLE